MLLSRLDSSHLASLCISLSLSHLTEFSHCPVLVVYMCRSRIVLQFVARSVLYSMCTVALCSVEYVFNISSMIIIYYTRAV